MFITRAIERGVDVKVIAQWQGHQDGAKLILQTSAATDLAGRIVAFRCNLLSCAASFALALPPRDAL